MERFEHVLSKPSEPPATIGSADVQQRSRAGISGYSVADVGFASS